MELPPAGLGAVRVLFGAGSIVDPAGRGAETVPVGEPAPFAFPSAADLRVYVDPVAVQAFVRFYLGYVSYSRVSKASLLAGLPSSDHDVLVLPGDG